MLQKQRNEEKEDDENANEMNHEPNVLTFDDESEDLGTEENGDSDTESDFANDAFYQQLMNFEQAEDECEFENEDVKKEHNIIIDEKSLQKINCKEIFVIDYRQYCPIFPVRYLRCIIPEMVSAIIICPSCSMFFRSEDFEISIINHHNMCPFCRHIF